MASNKTSSTSFVTKKVTVLSPSVIKKIGLDKLINLQLKKAAPKQSTSSDSVEINDEPSYQQEATATIERSVVVDEKKSFCDDLKKNLQKALTNPKVNQVKKSQKNNDYIIKGQRGGTESNLEKGEKFKIVQNEVIGLKQETLHNILKQQRKKSPFKEVPEETRRQTTCNVKDLTKQRASSLNGEKIISLIDIDLEDDNEKDNLLGIKETTTETGSHIEQIKESPVLTQDKLIIEAAKITKILPPTPTYSYRKVSGITRVLTPGKRKQIFTLPVCPAPEFKTPLKINKRKRSDSETNERFKKQRELDEAVVTFGEVIDLDTDEQQIVTRTTPTPKKRGRKSNAELIKLGLLKPKEEEAEEVPILSPSQRGRVPKPKLFENYVIPKKKRAKEPKIPKGDDVPVKVKTPNKRGRKPRNKIDEDIVALPQLSSSLHEESDLEEDTALKDVVKDSTMSEEHESGTLMKDKKSLDVTNQELDDNKEELVERPAENNFPKKQENILQEIRNDVYDEDEEADRENVADCSDKIAIETCSDSPGADASEESSETEILINVGTSTNDNDEVIPKRRGRSQLKNEGDADISINLNKFDECSSENSSKSLLTEKQNGSLIQDKPPTDSVNSEEKALENSNEESQLQTPRSRHSKSSSDESPFLKPLNKSIQEESREISIEGSPRERRVQSTRSSRSRTASDQTKPTGEPSFLEAASKHVQEKDSIEENPRESQLESPRSGRSKRVSDKTKQRDELPFLEATIKNVHARNTENLIEEHPLQSPRSSRSRTASDRTKPTGEPPFLEAGSKNVEEKNSNEENPQETQLESPKSGRSKRVSDKTKQRDEPPFLEATIKNVHAKNTENLIEENPLQSPRSSRSKTASDRTKPTGEPPFLEAANTNLQEINTENSSGECSQDSNLETTRRSRSRTASEKNKPADQLPFLEAANTNLQEINTENSSGECPQDSILETTRRSRSRTASEKNKPTDQPPFLEAANTNFQEMNTDNSSGECPQDSNLETTRRSRSRTASDKNKPTDQPPFLEAANTNLQEINTEKSSGECPQDSNLETTRRSRSRTASDKNKPTDQPPFLDAANTNFQEINTENSSGDCPQDSNLLTTRSRSRNKPTDQPSFLELPNKNKVKKEECEDSCHEDKSLSEQTELVKAEPVEISTPQRRRRGRPRKKAQTLRVQKDVASPNDSKVKCGRKRKRNVEESPSTSTSDGVDEPSKTLKLQENCNTTENANVADQSIEEDEEEEDAYSKQCRLLVSNLVKDIREQITKSEPKPKSPNQTVTCAICQENLKPTEWNFHKQRYHNNLAWKASEAPLELNSQSEILATLHNLYPSKPFFCNHCKDSKKSVYGFLAHKITCNKSQEEIEEMKIPCLECPKMLLPHQLIDHDKKHKNERTKMKTIVVSQEISDCGTPRKRTAAKRASELIHKVSQELIGDGEEIPASLLILKKFFVKNDYKQKAIQEIMQKFIKTNGHINCLFNSCEYKFNDLKDIMEHLASCREKPEIFFICKVCTFVHEILADMKVHLMEHHQEIMGTGKDDNYDIGNEGNLKNETDDEDEDDGENDEPKSSRKRKFVPPSNVTHANAFWKLQKFSLLSKTINYPKDCPCGINSLAYGKMLDFCKENYVKDLFLNYPFKKANWFQVNKNYIADYLPIFKTSIPIAQELRTTLKPKNVQDDKATFTSYKLFQTSIDNGIATVFCGGPVSAMAWAPTPYDKEDSEQMLAVCVQQDPDYKYTTKKTHTNKSIIQLWNFGVLNNVKQLETMPKLELCIAHNFGGIFSMEWCPSGCYELNGTRLGLLAITSTDSHVYCYCIGHSNLLIEKICKPKPIFKLVFSENCDINIGNTDYYPTKLSWSKAEGHKYLAVGYTNGCVAMFNLQTEDELLKGVDERNIPSIYPYKVFKAHRLQITALALHHMNGGNRWLVTSSIDRMFQLWDLHSLSMHPLVTTKRACSYHMLWPVNSMATIDAHEDGSSNLFLNTTASQFVTFDYTTSNNMIYSNAPVRSVSGHDWGATVYHANEIGEVAGASYNNLYPFMLETSIKRFFCSSTSVISENDNEKSWEDDIHFKTARKKYKILFHDYKLDDPKKLIKQERSRMSFNAADSSKYPLEAATVVSTNNNRYSFLFSAVGYNIGFVRVFHSKFHNINALN